MNIDLAWSPWRKSSSYSGPESNCVEIAPVAWRKSSYSGAEQNCVQVAGCPSTRVGVRDSKDPGGPALTFGPRAWRGFIAAVTSGGFDRL